MRATAPVVDDREKVDAAGLEAAETRINEVDKRYALC